MREVGLWLAQVGRVDCNVSDERLEARAAVELQLFEQDLLHVVLVEWILLSRVEFLGGGQLVELLVFALEWMDSQKSLSNSLLSTA